MAKSESVASIQSNELRQRANELMEKVLETGSYFFHSKRYVNVENITIALGKKVTIHNLPFEVIEEEYSNLQSFDNSIQDRKLPCKKIEFGKPKEKNIKNRSNQAFERVGTHYYLFLEKLKSPPKKIQKDSRSILLQQDSITKFLLRQRVCISEWLCHAVCVVRYVIGSMEIALTTCKVSTHNCVG